MEQDKKKPLKMLACGDVRGKFTAFMKRLKTVEGKAGPFELVLCCGDFFGDDDSKNEADQTLWSDICSGKTKVPMPIYVLGPVFASQKSHYPDADGCEFAEDVIYLGKGGCLTTGNGLKVAYASGPGLDFDLVKSMEVQARCDDPNFSGVDVLMTSEWPRGMASADNKVKEADGQPLVTRLAVKLRPRYHFAGLKHTFHERLPYRNHRVMSEPAKHVTRFIGLAQVGNEDKKMKWIYAFNIVPLVHMDKKELVAQPQTLTDMPYKEEHIKVQGATQQQFFYDMNAPMDDPNGRKRRRDQDNFQAKRPPPKPTGPCWFCLSGAEVEKHLVVSVGDNVYLALPKGPLTENHVLILPIGHHASSLELPDDVAQEVEKFKAALKKFYKHQGMVGVFFERNYKSQHMQLQAVGVPKECAVRVKSNFIDCGSSMELEMDEVPSHATLSQLAEPGTPYFYVELPENKERLFHRVRRGFPIQFGREVLATETLLNVQSRIDWRQCQVGREEEAEMTKAFRKRFAPFDFTLEDDE